MTELFFMCMKDHPLILFSHIPLYRPPYSDCGRLREKGSIPVARGEGYQTLLSPETSQLLLNTLRPSLIFRYFLSLLSPSPSLFNSPSSLSSLFGGQLMNNCTAATTTTTVNIRTTFSNRPSLR